MIQYYILLQSSEQHELVVQAAGAGHGTVVQTLEQTVRQPRLRAETQVRGGGGHPARAGLCHRGREAAGHHRSGWVANVLGSVQQCKRTLLSGISTESGIPDYRSEDVGLYATSTKRPMQHKVFMESSKARQSYWARNFVGWPRWSGFLPNTNHRTLARWEGAGLVSALVTQNVDQLHYKAGSRHVIELHGTNSTVTRMSCCFTQPRIQFQRELERRNPAMIAKVRPESSVSAFGGIVPPPIRSVQTDIIRPDGDVELTLQEVENFHVPDCPKCGGILKPYVVFFGDNVPAARVAAARKEVSKCDRMLGMTLPN